MILYYDARVPSIAFGMQQVQKALVSGYTTMHLDSFDHSLDVEALVVRISHGGVQFEPQCKTIHDLEPEGFEIICKQQVIFVNAYDTNGAMYGLLDIAETIVNEGRGAIGEKVCNPFHTVRGIKHNLPYEPYDMGEPFSENFETMMDISYWKAYLEMLALNRYNTLSLWAENPFPMMFRLEKYPNTTPFTDRELETYQKCFNFIFEYAWKLGISTYLITWNVRLTPQIAEGLGLPKGLGDMADRYDAIRDSRVGIPHKADTLDSSRCHLEVIKDYMKECIKTVCLSYKYLTGIGTSSSEEMSGSAEERVRWIQETYQEGIKESGRTIPFIFRTNATATSSIIDNFMDSYTYGERYLSWKYSIAHMYASVEPMMEKAWNAWNDVDLEGLHILYTVRNDDFHTFRGGSYPFIQKYLKGMKRNHLVKGFYWGADGYVWGRDFQHVPHKHITWKYDWEKHWYQFMLLGRLGYDPNTPKEVFIQAFERQHGKTVGKYFFEGCNQAMEILSSVQRTNWVRNDFGNHPESLLTASGFSSVLALMDREAMPCIGTLSVNETALNIVKKQKSSQEDSLACIALIAKATSEIEKQVSLIEQETPSSHLVGELECALLDLKCWGYLGRYYVEKLSATLDLCCLRYSGNETYRASAVQHLKDAIGPFELLASTWASHYMPYKMVRSKYMFGYTYYIDEVKKDIRIAKNITFEG
nr:hypothetical protein [uncultured Sphaerochaeta sp.]